MFSSGCDIKQNVTLHSVFVCPINHIWSWIKLCLYKTNGGSKNALSIHSVFFSPFTMSCYPKITFHPIRYILKMELLCEWLSSYLSSTSIYHQNAFYSETCAYIILHNHDSRQGGHKIGPVRPLLMQHTSMDLIDRIAGSDIKSWTYHTHAFIHWVCSLAWFIVSALDFSLTRRKEKKRHISIKTERVSCTPSLG